MFARLFGTDDDQVLVMLDADEDGTPQIKIYWEPPGFGVCSTVITMTDDSDKSWDTAEMLLRESTEESIRQYLQKNIDKYAKGGSE